jgi:magnesium transporter
VAARWLDLVDPTREQLMGALPVALDPDVVEMLVAPAADGRAIRPLIESHGTYVLAVLAVPATEPHADRIEYRELDVVATLDAVVTVRRATADPTPADVAVAGAATEAGATAGELVHAIVEEVVDRYLDLLDVLYGAIDELEDHVDRLSGPVVRRRLVELRHELLHARRTVSSTRAAVRKIVDRRCELAHGELFPRDVEIGFAETYETLVRATEELDVARELLGSVRDYYQAKITEAQNDVVKKLTVIASLVLVPSLIVGFYGQNFEEAFDGALWTLGASIGLIAASTLGQLALYRWRRWI